MEELSRRPAQRVYRQITGEDDGHGVKDWAIHISSRGQNHFVQVVGLPFPQRQFAIDVLDHDHRAVDHDSEVDGADGEQVGRDIMGVQHDECEEQGQRNRERNDDRGAEADQKKDQDDQHQHHAAKQVRFHGVGRELHQVAAIIIGVNFDVGRKHRPVQFVGLGLDSFQYGLGLLAAAHQDHALDRIVIFLKAELPQARSMADDHVADIAHPDGYAVVAADYDVRNVFGVAHQADAADVIELATLGIEAPAGVGIVRRQGRADLRNRQVISVHAGGIEQHLVLHDFPAQTGVVGHAGNGAVGALDHPVFNGLQLLRTAIGTLQHVAVHQAAGAEQRRHGGGHAGWKRGIRQPLKNDLPGQIVVRALFEGQAQIGKTIQRNGPHGDHARDAVHLQFERQRNQAFHFLGGVAGPLRDEFDLRRSEVGVGVHRHALERQDSADCDETSQHQHQKPLAQRSLDDAMNHLDVASTLCNGFSILASAAMNWRTAETSCRHLRCDRRIAARL